MFDVTHLVGFGAQAFSMVKVAAGAIAYDSNNQTTYGLSTTPPNDSIASTSTINRYLIGALLYDAGSSTTTNISNVTLSSVSQTAYVNGSNILMPTAFFIAQNGVEGAQTVAFTGSGGTNGFSAFFSVTGAATLAKTANSHTSTASGSELSVTVDVPARGIVFALAVHSSNNTPNTPTWVGVDAAVTSYLGTDNTTSLAYRKYPNAAAGQAITVTYPETDRMGLGVLVVQVS